MKSAGERFGLHHKYMRSTQHMTLLVFKWSNEKSNARISLHQNSYVLFVVHTHYFPVCSPTKFNYSLYIIGFIIQIRNEIL